LGWIEGQNVRIDVRLERGMPLAFANRQRNWSRCRRT
jgi:hypothetical protein